MDAFLEQLTELCEQAPSGFIRILRVSSEYSHNTGTVRHGPNWHRLPAPYRDTPSHNMQSWERCGTLPHQFRDWWPVPEPEQDDDWGSRMWPPGQRVYVLELPASKVVRQERQVIYQPEFAWEVASFIHPH